MDKPMFAQRLVELRAEQKLSQYKLAEILGFSRGQIANYEQGRCASMGGSAQRVRILGGGLRSGRVTI